MASPSLAKIQPRSSKKQAWWLTFADLILGEFAWFRRWQSGPWTRVRSEMHPAMERWVRGVVESDEPWETVVGREEYRTALRPTENRRRTGDQR